MPTRSIDIFCQMCQACRRGIAMKPRSPKDKEYFPQDWFIDRLKELSLPYVQQGRNSYPDFWVAPEQEREGYEIKSLAFAGGKLARDTIDFNSTIPSGRKHDSWVFIVFLLYEGSGAEDRTVHSISVAHGDLINADHDLADEHLNVAVHGFGSFADGFIRNRKMYVFPHPISIDPQGLGRNRLIVPATWKLTDPRIRRTNAIERVVAPETMDRYTIRLRGRGQAEIVTESAPDAGWVHRFQVFEMA